MYSIVTFLLIFVEINSQTTTTLGTTSTQTINTIIKCFRARVESADIFGIAFIGNEPIIPDSLLIRISQHQYTNDESFEDEIIFEAESIQQECRNSPLIIPVTIKNGVEEAMIQIEIKNLGLLSTLELFEVIVLSNLQSHDVKLEGIQGVGTIEVRLTPEPKIYIPNECKLDACPSSLQKLTENQNLCLSFNYKEHKHTFILKGNLLMKKKFYRHYEIQIQTMHPRRNSLVEKISLYSTARPCSSDETQPSIKINVDRDIDQIIFTIIDEIEKIPLKAVYNRRARRFVLLTSSSNFELENVNIKQTTPSLAIQERDAIQVYLTRNSIDTRGTKYNHIIVTQSLKGRVAIEKRGVYQDSSQMASKVVKIRKASKEEIEQCLASKSQ